MLLRRSGRRPAFVLRLRLRPCLGGLGPGLRFLRMNCRVSLLLGGGSHGVGVFRVGMLRVSGIAEASSCRGRGCRSTSRGRTSGCGRSKRLTTGAIHCRSRGASVIHRSQLPAVRRHRVFVGKLTRRGRDMGFA